MKRTISIATVASFAALFASAFAQNHDHAKAAATPSATTTPAAPMADGEVRRVDKDGGKITLKHGEIKSLDMPAMTMVFNVKEKSMLEKIQVGDKVKFAAISEAGKYVVTDLQVTK